VASADTVEAASWFLPAKRALLSPVAVGTVDQLLIAAAKVRYGMLRFTGLAGKVVNVDEVHAYDAYMDVFLRRCLEWLGRLGVPVVLLSATLPANIRHHLAAAYGGPNQVEITDSRDYPSITVIVPGRRSRVASVDDGNDDKQLEVEWWPQHDPEAVQELGERLLPLIDGEGCMLAVCNTVNRAQCLYRKLRELGAPPADITLIHSRFTRTDRARLNSELIERFGCSSSSRPRRHIVVAAQVVEQSIDVDFEMVVSDLEPIDLLSQRAGQAHRIDRHLPASVVPTRAGVILGCFPRARFIRGLAQRLVTLP